MTKFHQDMTQSVILGQYPQIWSFEPRPPKTDFLETFDYKWKLRPLCIQRAINHFLIKDFQKMKNDKKLSKENHSSRYWIVSINYHSGITVRYWPLNTENKKNLMTGAWLTNKLSCSQLCHSPVFTTMVILLEVVYKRMSHENYLIRLPQTW